MNVTVEQLAKGVLLVVEGQVDMHTSPELRGRLRAKAAQHRQPAGEGLHVAVARARGGFAVVGGLACIDRPRRAL